MNCTKARGNVGQASQYKGLQSRLQCQCETLHGAFIGANETFCTRACAKEDPKNRTEKNCTEVGADTLGKAVDGIISNYHKRDCLIHSDSHVFNILVEPKPSIVALELFGLNGSMVLCDWEMAMAGPIGRDVGPALSFPIACYISHALHGLEVESIFKYIALLVHCYLNKMGKAGMDRKTQAALYGNIIGWTGWFQFVGVHMLRAQDIFPVQNQDTKACVHNVMGLLCLKLMRFSMDKDHISDLLTLNQLKSIFEEMLDEDVSSVYASFGNETHCSKHIIKPRQSSFLRAVNRRISDARMNFSSTKACLEGLDGMDDEYVEEVICDRKYEMLS